MVSRMIFQEHVELTHPQVRRLEAVLFYSILTAGVCLTSAIAGRDVLPVKLRSALLGTSTLSLIATAGSYELWRRANERYQPYREGQERQLNLSNAATEFETTLIAEAESKLRAVDAIRTMNAPAEFKIAFLHQQGLLDLLTGGEEVLKHKRQQTAPAAVVDTTAQALPAQQQAATPNYPGEAIAPSYTPAPKKSPLEKIPFEDLAQTLANSTADPSCATSVLIAAPRRCGKSNLIRQAIAYANELHKSNIDFNVWNAGKDDEDYCGLQNHDPDYLFTANAENIPTAVQLLLGGDDVDAMPLIRRCDRWMGQPTLLIGDEWNNTLLAAEMNDKMNSRSKSRDMLIAGSSQYVTRGPGKLALGWFTSHSGQVGSLGWNTDILKNISAIAIARIGQNDEGQIVRYGETLKQALRGGGGGTSKESWIADPDERAKFLKLFEDWFATDECGVVALTNLLGEWRMVRLPKYPDKHPAIARGPMNQSVAELTGLEAPQSGGGNPKPVNVYTEVKATLGSSPTVAEVKAAWEKVTGNRLTEDAAREFIRALDAGIL